MKIKCISDIHFEFHPDGGKAFVESLPNNCDVLVVAGDLTTHKTGIAPALSMLCQKFKRVVYTPGNHEYWGTTKGQVNRSLDKARARNPNLYVLSNSVAEIEGQRFVGGTMWFSETVEAMRWAHSWADFAKIKGLRNWIFNDNRKFAALLQSELKQGDIVVSHHLPSSAVVSDRYKNNPGNCYFISEMSNEILDKKPAVWFFGHTHDSRDMMLGDTRMVCNPFGYFDYETNGKFDPYLVVEI